MFPSKGPQFTAFLIFLFSAVYITYPLIFHLNQFTTGFGDELLIAWIQNHTVFSLIHNPFQLFQGNIFYPYQNTIAFSDLFLTSSVLSAIPVYLLKEPITAVNFTLFTSLVMLGFSIFLLSYYLTKNFLASILSGLLVIFSPAVLDKKVHLQILTIWFVPLSIMFFLQFLKNKKSKWLVFSMFFFVLQTANSFMPGYFLVFFFAISLLVLWFKDKQMFKGLISPRNVLIFVCSLLVIAPLVFPYFKVAKDYGGKRDIRDSVHFALQPEDFLVAGGDSRFQNVLPQALRVDKFHNGEIKPGFIGLTFSVLALSSIVYFLKKKKKDFVLISLFFTGTLGLIASLGPALHWGRATIHHPFLIPLPYALFYYLLPGFEGFRNSARWEMLFIICFAVAIALMLADFFKKRGKAFLLSLILGTLIVGEFNFPMKFYNVPKISEFSKAYNFLSYEKQPAIFLPICNWNDKCAGEEFRRVYFSTEGFPRMVNGTSGFSPLTWESNIQKINREFPNDKSLTSIKQTGAKYIVFEKDVWEKYSKKNVLPQLLQNKRLNLLKRFDNTYVFEL